MDEEEEEGGSRSSGSSEESVSYHDVIRCSSSRIPLVEVGVPDARGCGQYPQPVCPRRRACWLGGHQVGEGGHVASVRVPPPSRCRSSRSVYILQSTTCSKSSGMPLEITLHRAARGGHLGSTLPPSGIDVTAIWDRRYRHLGSALPPSGIGD